jgi:acylphosphatase
MKNTEIKQFKITFLGRVHGVGFRFTTQSLAQQLKINGYVKNMPEGSVELMVTCSKEQLNTLLKKIKAYLNKYITNIEIQESLVNETFTNFTIRF